MTKSEMTELFAAIMLLYPHDKLFSRGIEALKPTIELWTKVVNIDFQTAQRALILAFRKCKFPPTPADILEAAADLQSYLVSKVDEAVSSIKSGCFLHGSLEAYYDSLGKGSPIRAAIDAVGGPSSLYVSVNSGQIWTLEAFEASYRTILLCEQPSSISGKNTAALPVEAISTHGQAIHWKEVK